MNSPIGQSISKCKEDIRTILYRLKAFYEPCDLDTARGFTDNFIQGLNKVFDDFLAEAFVDQPNDHNNIEQKDEAAASPIIPIIKEEDNSDEIYVPDSDDETFQIKVEPEETPMPMDVAMQSENNYDSSVNEFTGNASNVMSVEREPSSDNSIDRAVRREKLPKKSWSYEARNKIPTACDVCKAEFKSSFSLIAHRRIHLDQFDFHCRICLLGFFQKYDRNCHEEKCKNRRYECYMCHYFGMSTSMIKRHLRVHTDMASHVLSKAQRKRLSKKMRRREKLVKYMWQQKRPQ